LCHRFCGYFCQTWQTFDGCRRSEQILVRVDFIGQPPVIHDASAAHEAMLAKLNADTAHGAPLQAHKIGQEVTVNPGYYGEARDEVEVVLKSLKQEVYFVDDLSYEQLVAIAIAELRKNWTREIAKSMVHAVGGDFSGIRDFLKQKDSRLVLVGYNSLDNYDLSRVVTVDDFITEDALFIRHGISLQNFRRTDALASITDSTCGRPTRTSG
jgi:hypothetical protein